MSVFEGLNLCPDAITVRGNPERYIDTSRRIFNILLTFTEKVEIYSIDEGFLEITLEDCSYKNLKQIGLSIKRAIFEGTFLTCSVGISCNKTIAKIASDLCKPDGIMVICENEISGFMERLPVGKVPGIGPKTAEQLNLMGIELCGQVTRIPLSFLKKGLELKVRKYGIYAVEKAKQMLFFNHLSQNHLVIPIPWHRIQMI